VQKEVDAWVFRQLEESALLVAVRANSGSELLRYSKAEKQIHRSGSTDDPDGARVTSMQARKTGKTVFLGLSNGTVHIFDETDSTVTRMQIFKNQCSIDLMCLEPGIKGSNYLYMANKEQGLIYVVLLQGTDLVQNLDVKTYKPYQGSSLLDMKLVLSRDQMSLAQLYSKGGIA